MTTPVLITEQVGAKSVITLNRPDRRNALTIELLERLCQTLEEFTAQVDCRVIVLRGAGPAFCAGLDLYEAGDADLADRSAELVARTYQAVLHAAPITVAAVHGAAYAGGAGLMACCDFAVASDAAQICFPEVRRGLVPAFAAVVLTGRIRDFALRELMLLAAPIDAPCALRMGLVDRVVPAAELAAAVDQLSAAILAAAPGALRQTKEFLQALRGSEWEERFRHALAMHRQARRGAEAREGLAAFRERRPPAWLHDTT